MTTPRGSARFALGALALASLAGLAACSTAEVVLPVPEIPVDGGDAALEADAPEGSLDDAAPDADDASRDARADAADDDGAPGDARADVEADVEVDATTSDAEIDADDASADSATVDDASPDAAEDGALDDASVDASFDAGADAPVDAAPIDPCLDGVRDGDESDVDCGGSCAPCTNGAHCSAPADCWSAACTSGLCTGCRAGTVAHVVGPVAYCVDAHEVTQGEYAAFLASGKLAATPAACAYKSAHAPVTSGVNGCTTDAYEPATRPNAPVVCVDFCDASAYCASHGQRLCGALGGGEAGFYDFVDPARDEWFAACSDDGARSYPYGSVYDPAACVGGDRGAIDPSDVGTASGCVGGIGGLFDMSGNVSEWESSCDGTLGANDYCRLRGGSYAVLGGAFMRCDADYYVNRGAAYRTVGFRCCGG